jgi:hypothetical protein
MRDVADEVEDVGRLCCTTSVHLFTLPVATIVTGRPIDPLSSCPSESGCYHLATYPASFAGLCSRSRTAVAFLGTSLLTCLLAPLYCICCAAHPLSTIAMPPQRRARAESVAASQSSAADGSDIDGPSPAALVK